jgi:hypothetical protein
MDYEWRIKLAERELAHLKELQGITRAHFDVTGQARETFGTTLERIEDNLEKLSAGVRQLQAAQLVTEQKLQNLIEILAREHANGKSRG